MLLLLPEKYVYICYVYTYSRFPLLTSYEYNKINTFQIMITKVMN